MRVYAKKKSIKIKGYVITLWTNNTYVTKKGFKNYRNAYIYICIKHTLLKILNYPQKKKNYCENKSIRTVKET